MLKRALVYFSVVSLVTGGRIDVKASTEKVTTERSHMELIMENIMTSIDEDTIKVLDTKNGTIYDSNVSKGKPDLWRKFVDKLHSMNVTRFDESETTTELHPESTSHSNLHERTAHTRTTVHKTKRVKATTEVTPELMPTIHYSRSKRSFSKDEIESFAEMGKVFSESFKKFNDDAAKAQKDFMSFMKKLDEMSTRHDRYYE